MILLSFVIYHISVDKLGKRAEEQVASALQMGNHYIQRLFVDLKDVMNVITINPKIQQLLNDTQIDDYEYVYHIKEARSTITTITQNKPYITSFVVYSLKHEADKQLYKRPNTYLTLELRNQIFNELLQENNIVWWNNRTLTDFSYDSSSMVIGRVLRDIKNQYEPSGFILLEIEKDAFFEGLSFLNATNDSHFFVLDDNEELVHSLQTIGKQKFFNQSAYLSRFSGILPKTIEERNFDGEQYIVSSETISNLPWRFVYLVQSSKFYSDASFILKITIGVLFTVFLIGCFIAFYFSRAVTMPLNQLSRVIRSNNYDDQDIKNFNPDDEVGQIGVRFLNMQKENKQLNDQIIHAILKRKEAEIQTLQAQINPHFLYNTLDSISWLAIAHKQFQISEIVSYLGSFFRLSLSKGKNVLTIRDELEHVMAYVQVQKFRYRDLFDLVLEVEEEIQDFYTPKLLLQPVVENALYHGIKLKGTPGTIMITGEKCEAGICFHITDDGKGMEKDKLDKLNRSINGENLLQLYGLKNVHDRLRLQFGSPFGVHVYSEYGKFTTVTITVPQLTTLPKEELSND